ncbi:MAG: tetratricopeptide repeat protein [Methylococcaceae bacterium]|nr:tetratricopeptide repeat protein [Methylococcaceae bacterium]
MKQIIAFFLVFIFNLVPTSLRADELALAVQHIESEWARIYYSVAKELQDKEFKQLLSEVTALNAQHPKQAELIIQQAIIVATNADNVGAFSALEAIHEARDLLVQAIELNPKASQGAAFVTLGALYYRVPAWPIAYGDKDKAQKLLETALAINANTIDANYYYADFLASQGKPQQARKYFNRAIAIPVRETQVLADTQLQKQAKLALNKHEQKERKQDCSLAAN